MKTKKYKGYTCASVKRIDYLLSLYLEDDKGLARAESAHRGHLKKVTITVKGVKG